MLRRREVLGAALGGAPALSMAASALNAWPAEVDPGAIGRRVARRLLASPYMQTPAHGPQSLHYAEVVTWVGALQFAGLAGDKELSAQLVERFLPFREIESPRVPRTDHVDANVFGALPLELYIQGRRHLDRSMGLAFADSQWDQPRPDGLSRQSRFWIDDMYMITALQVQAWRATAETRYLDRAARTLEAYLARLQQPNGLFFHTLEAPIHWGRGNGWVASGLTELLRDLPAAHPQRPAIMAGYQKMMRALLSHQAANGMWRQVIDLPTSWEESSSTAMFTFAFVNGVKNGWLPEAEFGGAARRAWIALASYLNEEGDLREVCIGTGHSKDVAYYLARPRVVGDKHGQAPMLWTAAALLR